MADNDIVVKLVADTKGLQDRIGNSTLSQSDKNILSAKLSEALNALNKGANASAKDLTIASNNIRSIIKELVTAASGAKGVSEALAKAQKTLESATSNRDKLVKESKKIQRHQVSPTGELRGAEADRLAKQQHVTGKNGKEILTYETLKKAADSKTKDEVQATAAQAMHNIDAIFQTYKQRLDELNNNLIPQADQSVKNAAQEITKIETTDPMNSAAVEMQQFGNELQNLIDKLKTINEDAHDVQPSGGLADVNPTADVAELESIDANKNNNSLGKAFKQFSLYAIALRSIKTAAREAISTIKELDKSLTEQAMVTGKTRTQTYALLSSYQEMAAALGTTTKEVASVATEYMRQGKTVEESLTLTTAAVSAAKVAGISAAESIDYLTTALNGFQLSADDAMSVSDKFAAVAATSATDYEELAVALSKVASQANLAGMSIDYTTALLAKGIETTREAPETIGTALKTVIARMREISDYGETLDGSTDVNNVETQLAYVGIDLKNVNGELRSTEDVLNELGKKWDTLNSNQQAAIAKALAGTRQQSRLIAMMTDYERVIELQEVSERSSGATVAQMETYLEGMEAALNNVSIAWEKIVTSLTDSETIVTLINSIANVLDWIGGLLTNEKLTLGLIIALGATTLIQLTKKYEMQKAENRAILEQNKAQIQLTKHKKESYLQTLLTLKADTADTKQQIKQQYIERGYTAEQAEAMANSLETKQQENWINAEIAATKSEITDLTIKDAETTLQITQNGVGLTSILSQSLSLLTPILSVLSLINGVQQAIVLHKKAEALATADVNKKEKQGLANKIAGMVTSMVSSAKTIPGVIAMIVAAGALATALGFGIAAATGALSGVSETDKTSDEINSLSNDIYKLTQKAESIKTITSSYEELDNQIVKTKEDQEEMNSLLEQAADSLDDDEKEIYEALSTNTLKKQYLDSIKKQTLLDANSKRQEQLKLIKNMSPTAREQILSSEATDTDVLTAQSALYAIANNEMYDYIDAIEEASSESAEYWDAIESVTQAMLEGVTPAEAYYYAQNPEKIEEIVKALSTLKDTYTDANGEIQTVGVAEILNSDDYGLKEKVEAFKKAQAALAGTSIYDSFMSTYQDLDNVMNIFSSDILDWIDSLGITTSSINDLSDALLDLGYSTEQASSMLAQLFQQMEEGGSIGDAIKKVFGIDESVEAYEAILNAYEKAVGTTILDMGQNLESLKNQVSTIYETAQKWNEMSDSEKTEFLSDNSELFSGSDGAQLLKAFETGDYQKIKAALQQNKTLAAKIQTRIQDLQTQLDIEENRAESDKDYATIQYLQEQLDYLNDVEKIYSADLDLRLEQEEAYLEQYKSYLEEQRDALQDSLDERKEAYENYFETVNQEAEDEDFEEQESTLIANITKLASSSSADALNQSKELEQSLEDLEKDRLDTLRERAQDQILDNIDDQLDLINDKFDDLLNSNQALLAAMTGQLDDPTGFVTNLISSKATSEGLTALGIEDYIQTLSTTYGSLIGTDLFDQISVEQSSSNNLVLNVAGTQIELSNNDQQSVYDAIMKALRAVGAI